MLDIVGLNYDEMLLQLASGDGMLPKSVENMQPSISTATKAMQKRNLAIMQAISEVGFENAQNTNPNDMAAMVVNENNKTHKKRSSRSRLTGGAMPNNGSTFKGCINSTPMSMSFHNQWTMMQKQQMRSFNNAQQQWQQQQQQLQHDYMTQQLQYSQMNQPSNAQMSGLPIPQWACANGSCQLNPQSSQEMTMLVQDNTMYSNSSVMDNPYENFIHTLPCRPPCDSSSCQRSSQVTMPQVPKKFVDVTTSTTAQQSLTINSSVVSINESSIQESSSDTVMQQYRRYRGGSHSHVRPSKAELMQQLADLKKRLQHKDSGKPFKYKNNARSRRFWESNSSVFTPKASSNAASALTCHQRTYKPYMYPSESPFCSEKVKSQMIVNYTPVRGTKIEAETAKTVATFSDSKMLKKRHRHHKQQQHHHQKPNPHSPQKVVSKYKSHHHKNKKKIGKAPKTKTQNNQKELDTPKDTHTHTSIGSKDKEVKVSFSKPKTKFKESAIWSFDDSIESVNAIKGKSIESKKISKHKKGSILHYVDPKKSIKLRYMDKPDTMIFNHVSNDASHNEVEDTMTINGKKPVNIYVHYTKKILT